MHFLDQLLIHREILDLTVDPIPLEQLAVIRVTCDIVLRIKPKHAHRELCRANTQDLKAPLKQLGIKLFGRFCYNGFRQCPQAWDIIGFTFTLIGKEPCGLIAHNWNTIEICGNV